MKLVHNSQSTGKKLGEVHVYPHKKETKITLRICIIHNSHNQPRRQHQSVKSEATLVVAVVVLGWSLLFYHKNPYEHFVKAAQQYSTKRGRVPVPDYTLSHQRTKNEGDDALWKCWCVCATFIFIVLLCFITIAWRRLLGSIASREKMT